MADFVFPYSLPGMGRLLDRRDGYPFREAEALFILTTGRTGTVTVVQLLDASPRVMALHEPAPLLLRKKQASFERVHSDPAPFRRLFIKSRYALVRRAARQGMVYAEATEMRHFGPVIADVMPRAKFMYLYRHPGDVVRSGMRRGWYRDGGYYDRYRVRPGKGDPARKEWDDWDAFTKNCWLWRAENDSFLRCIDALPQERSLSMSFERLFEKDGDAYREMFTFLGVAPPSREAARAVLEVRHNAQEGPDFPRYGDWSEEQRRTLQEMAGPTMARLGYA